MILLLSIIIFLIAPIFPVNAQEYQLELQQVTDTNQSEIITSVLPIQNRQELAESGFTIIDGSPTSTISLKIDKTALSIPDLPEGGENLQDVGVSSSINNSEKTQIVYELASKFETGSGQSIPGTKCDKICNEKIGGVWTDPESYGWGYSTDGRKTYRPFALPDENMNTFPLDVNASQEKSKLSFKLNLPKNFPSGSYHSTLKMIAMPMM